MKSSTKAKAILISPWLYKLINLFFRFYDIRLSSIFIDVISFDSKLFLDSYENDKFNDCHIAYRASTQLVNRLF